MRLLVWILLFHITASQAQQSFDGIWSSGNIPQDFIKTSGQKFQADIATIDQNLKRSEQRTRESFYLQSNYVFDQLLKGGSITFGDPVTKYLEGVLDKVLAADPKLRKELRIYTFKSTIPNAFTNGSGIILVTTGLLAQLENEAELAFILAHEAVHYREQHAINNYVENTRLLQGRGLYRNLSAEEVELTQFQYSRDLETESDLEGLEYYLKTDYQPDAAIAAMDVLLYSYLPFEEKPYDLHTWVNDYYGAMEKYTIPESAVNEIEAEEDYDDSHSTHPNIKSRKAELSEKLATIRSSGQALFLVADENRFLSLRDTCRYQNIMLNLRDLNYEAALYDVYMLQEKYPEDPQLEKWRFRCAYSLAMYETYRRTPSGQTSYKKVEGNSQPVYYFFQKLDKEDLICMAIRAGWKYVQANPDDSESRRMLKGLAYEFLYSTDLSLDAFMNEEAAVRLLSDTSATDIDDAGTKVTNIKKKKNQQEKEAYLNLFAEFIDDPSFRSFFDQQEISVNSDTDKEPESLHASRVLLIEPIYLRFDTRSDQPLKFEASAEAQANLETLSKSICSKLGIKLEYLDKHVTKGETADKLNELARLNDWFNEELDHLDADVPVINSSDVPFRQVVTAHNCSHVMWAGMASVRERSLNIFSAILGGFYFPPYLPFLLVESFTPAYTTQAFGLVADAETGIIEAGYDHSISMKDTPAVQKSLLYNMIKILK